MSLFDQIVRGVLGAATADSHAGSGNMLLDAALTLLQQSGGLSPLLHRLRRAGLGAETDSWVSTGRNLPLSADALRGALGGDVLTRIAEGLGVSPQELSDGLAKMLPNVVDRLTPQGEVPSEADEAIDRAISTLHDRPT